jgi:hypothetical protein
MMQTIKKDAVIKNRQLVLNIPKLSDNTAVEVFVLPKGSPNNQTFSSENRKQELLELLQSWREEEDDNEQRETWEYLKQTLDADRLSYRKLFQ